MLLHVIPPIFFLNHLCDDELYLQVGLVAVDFLNHLCDDEHFVVMLTKI